MLTEKKAKELLGVKKNSPRVKRLLEFAKELPEGVEVGVEFTTDDCWGNRPIRAREGIIKAEVIGCELRGACGRYRYLVWAYAKKSH